MYLNWPFIVIIISSLLMSSSPAYAEELEREDLLHSALIAQKIDHHLDAVKNLYAYMMINEGKLPKDQIVWMEAAIEESEEKLRVSGLRATALCADTSTGKDTKTSVKSQNPQLKN